MSGIFENFKAAIKTAKGAGKMDPIDELKSVIIDTVKERAGNFWDENEAARKFVAERAKRLAELAWQYKTASDDQVKAARKHSMEIVQQSIENELAAVALQGSSESKATFQAVLLAVTKVFVKVAPVLLTLV